MIRYNNTKSYSVYRITKENYIKKREFKIIELAFSGWKDTYLCISPISVRL